MKSTHTIAFVSLLWLAVPASRVIADAPEHAPRAVVEANDGATEARTGLATQLAAPTESVADAVLADDFEQARRYLEVAEEDDEVRELRSIVERMARMPECILASYEQDRGHEVKVGLRRGVQTLEILGVKEGRVRARKKVGATAHVGFEFGLGDLTPQEKFRRLGKDGDANGALLRGLFMWQMKRRDAAKKLFSESRVPFGAALVTAVERMAREESSREAATREAAADRETAIRSQKATAAFLSLLDTAGAPVGDKTSEQIVGALRDRLFTTEEVKQLQVALGAFRRDYGNHSVARENHRVLRILDIVRPNMRLRVDPARWEQAMAQLKRDNPNMKTPPKASFEEDGVVLNLCRVGGLHSISALAGLPIRSLDLTGGAMSTVEPLSGMPLRSLNLMDCGRVTDLSPLTGMPLTELVLYRCYRIQDVEPLRGLPLESLTLAIGKGLTDLKDLKDMPLTNLSLATCSSVSDLRPLRDMMLKELNLSGCAGITSLTALKGMPLEVLHLRGTSVRSLRPLQGMPLKTLDIEGLDVEVSPLEGMNVDILR